MYAVALLLRTNAHTHSILISKIVCLGIAFIFLLHFLYDAPSKDQTIMTPIALRVPVLSLHRTIILIPHLILSLASPVHFSFEFSQSALEFEAVNCSSTWCQPVRSNCKRFNGSVKQNWEIIHRCVLLCNNSSNGSNDSTCLYKHLFVCFLQTIAVPPLYHQIRETMVNSYLNISHDYTVCRSHLIFIFRTLARKGARLRNFLLILFNLWGSFMTESSFGLSILLAADCPGKLNWNDGSAAQKRHICFVC